MAAVTEEQVLEALKGVSDPDQGADIVSLGMVSGLVVKDGNVGFSIEVDPELGPQLEPLRKAAEAAVDNLSGVLSVTAVLTAEREAPSLGGGAGGDQGQQPDPQKAGPQQAPQPLAPGVKNIVAVASGKGGVGKSTTAINLALGLAAAGLRVGMLDADIYGPSQPRMMGVSGRPDSPDGEKLEPMVGHGIKVMSMGFLVADDTPMIWRGPMVMSALQQMLKDVNWGELDIMIVDMPPGTGDAQLTMAQQVPLAGAVIVSTPQDIALLDAFKDVAAAKQDAKRAENEATAYKNEVTQRAIGQAAQVVAAAEAYKEEQIAQASGETQRFLSVYREYVQDKDVTRRRLYLETMEQVLEGMDKVLVEEGKGGGSGVVPYLPLNELRNKRPASDGAADAGGQ